MAVFGSLVALTLVVSVAESSWHLAGCALDRCKTRNRDDSLYSEDGAIQAVLDTMNKDQRAWSVRRLLGGEVMLSAELARSLLGVQARWLACIVAACIPGFLGFFAQLAVLAWLGRRLFKAVKNWSVVASTRLRQVRRLNPAIDAILNSLSRCLARTPGERTFDGGRPLMSLHAEPNASRLSVLQRSPHPEFKVLARAIAKAWPDASSDTRRSLVAVYLDPASRMATVLHEHPRPLRQEHAETVMLAAKQVEAMPGTPYSQTSVHAADLIAKVMRDRMAEQPHNL